MNMPVLTDTSTMTPALLRLDEQVRQTRAALTASRAATKAAHDLRTYFPSGEPGRPGRYGKLPHWHIDLNPSMLRFASGPSLQLSAGSILWLRSDDKLAHNERGGYDLLTTTQEVEVESLMLEGVEPLIQSLLRLQAQFSR